MSNQNYNAGYNQTSYGNTYDQGQQVHQYQTDQLVPHTQPLYPFTRPYIRRSTVLYMNIILYTHTQYSPMQTNIYSQVSFYIQIYR